MLHRYQRSLLDQVDIDFTFKQTDQIRLRANLFGLGPMLLWKLCPPTGTIRALHARAIRVMRFLMRQTLLFTPGEIITCTFTNTQLGHIIVDKVTNPAGDAQMFDFNASWIPDVVGIPDFQLADGTTPYDSGALTPGTYSVAEVNIPTGWDFNQCNLLGQLADYSDRPGRG